MGEGGGGDPARPFEVGTLHLVGRRTEDPVGVAEGDVEVALLQRRLGLPGRHPQGRAARVDGGAVEVGGRRCAAAHRLVPRGDEHLDDAGPGGARPEQVAGDVHHPPAAAELDVGELALQGQAAHGRGAAQHGGARQRDHLPARAEQAGGLGRVDEIDHRVRRDVEERGEDVGVRRRAEGPGQEAVADVWPEAVEHVAELLDQVGGWLGRQPGPVPAQRAQEGIHQCGQATGLFQDEVDEVGVAPVGQEQLGPRGHPATAEPLQDDRGAPGAQLRAQRRELRGVRPRAMGDDKAGERAGGERGEPIESGTVEQVRVVDQERDVVGDAVGARGQLAQDGDPVAAVDAREHVEQDGLAVSARRDDVEPAHPARVGDHLAREALRGRGTGEHRIGGRPDTGR